MEETASGDLLYRFADVDSRTGALAFTSRDGVDVYALGAMARIAEETNPVGPSEDAALRLAESVAAAYRAEAAALDGVAPPPYA